MMLRVLSLGAGVQSSTLTLMAQHREIDPPDYAIFADTMSEPAAVYRYLEWLKQIITAFPIEIVIGGDLRNDLLSGWNRRKTARRASIPFYVDRLEQGSVQPGQAMRQCTADYKRDPLTRHMRKLLGVSPHDRLAPESCEVWLGISTDEAHRMKPARVTWQVNRYPLIEMRMSRAECLGWLQRHGYPRPEKSGCSFCPYRSDASWRHLHDTDPAAFEDACQIDDALRANRDVARLHATPYLHRSLKPLRNVDLDFAQLDLFGNECEGMCGV